MTRMTASQIYSAARSAGFSAASAVIATAVALGESGGDPADIGDRALENATWGPSVGLWQVRTLKSDTGTGRTRDIAALTGNVTAQARAAYEISSGGTSWNPWTVYKTGKYQEFMAQSQQAATTVGDSVAAATAGLTTTPAGIISDSLPAARRVIYTTIVVVFGLTLVGVGVARAVAPTVSKVRENATEQAGKVASVVI